jgi:hypothetical protein
MSDKPVKCPVCQSDEGCFWLSENGVPGLMKYGLKRAFSLTDGFTGTSTLQYSGLAAAPVLRGEGNTVKGKRTPFLGPGTDMPHV